MPFDLSLQIESERLVLVPLAMEWAQDIFLSFTPAVTRYMWPKPAERLDDTRAFIADALERQRAGSDLHWAALKDGRFAGIVGLHQLGQRDPELGLWMGESFHGQGYGFEAAAAVIAWARLHLEFEHLRYPVDKRNLASRRIPERHGAVVAREFKSTNQAGFELDQVEYWIPKERKQSTEDSEGAPKRGTEGSHRFH